MENLRSIKEKIRSCISCDENQCPMIKERLDQHVLSHHSSFKRSLSSQQISPHRRYSRIIYASRSNATSTNINEQTSTSDLINDKETKELNKPTYKEGLRAVILECIKKLPTYNNTSNGNVEENRINEFIEKISKLSVDYTDTSYGVKLDAEIDNFLYSLPLNINKENDTVMDNIKARIATKIWDFNKKCTQNSIKQNGTMNIDEGKNIKNKNPTTDSIGYIDNNKKDALVQNSDLNIMINSFSDKNNSFRRLNSNNSLRKRSVDTQVPSFLSTTFYENTETQTNLNAYKYDKINSRDDHIDIKENNIKKLIMKWLLQVNDEVDLDIAYSDVQSVTEELYNRLLPLVNSETDIMRNKLALKDDIINFIYEYFHVIMTNNNSLKLKKCIENLATSLLSETSNYENSYLQEQNTYFLNYFEKNTAIGEELLKVQPILSEIVNKYSEKYNTDYNSKALIEDIITLLSRNRQMIHRRDDQKLKGMLFKLIKSSTHLSDVNTADITNTIITTVNSKTEIDISDRNPSATINSSNQHFFGNIIPVFKSEQEFLEPSNNSGPPIRKRKSSILKKSKVNSEEQVYTEKLTDLMMAWVNNLPKKYSKSKDKKLKELLINKLVEDILDQVKLEQIAPETSNEKDKYLSFFIYRWLNRYEYFEDINDAKPYVDQLVEKIKNIPKPNSIKTQNARQKSTESINLDKSSSTYKESLEPNEINMLKNEILNWINEQQSKMFLKRDKSARNKMIHKFAAKIHETIHKCSPEQLSKEIEDWLVEIIKPDNKQNVPKLAETLESEIKKFIPNKKIEDSQKQKVSEQQRVNNLCCGGISTDSISENTLKALIAKYLEHKYDSENFIARKAYTRLLKNELQKLNSLSKLDKNMPFDQHQQASTLNNLFKEIQYIKIISEWLKNIPLRESLNNSEISLRAELVINLAEKIREIEDNRQTPSSEMEYKHDISIIISEFTEQLPIPSELKSNMQEMTNDLVSEISAVKHNFTINLNLTTKSNTDQNITDYIEAYIHENNEEIFEDDIKLEACILRLYREIHNVTNKNATSYNTCNFNKSDDALLPCNETIKQFTFEMRYAKEIVDWLKNLPLLPLADKTTQDQLVDLINNLAIKISETESDSDLTNYVKNWISKLPLDANKEIVLPVVIQQIMNRVNRINKKNVQEVHRTQKNTSKLKEVNPHNNILCKFPQSCCNKTITCNENRDPGTVIVEAVEKWCNNLPVQAENETISETLKENITTKLFQKLRELNMNPEYFNNNILYEKMLSEEIDIQLQNLLPNPILHHLKRELLEIIIEQRKEIKKKTSGVTYKHDLEKIIEISMPYSVSSQRDKISAFKIYKDRLASMFILENFDHGYDAVKLNYEKKIRKDIDKYFYEIQDVSAITLNKDQIYNELYNALFNVPLPSESSMINEIEEIKTRCEIDNWFETLPLREAVGVDELLERDQILAMLAKRLHEFEKYDKDCHNKMHKEITKWLIRLPLLPSQASNVEDFVNNLQQRLKSTLSDRRHVPRTTNKSQQSVVDQDKSIFNSSEVAESNFFLPLTSSPTLPFCCQTSSIQRHKKPADIILEIVETWCQQLPLPENTLHEKDNVKLIKDNLIIKIIMKISELNMNPETFNHDFLYDDLFDDELENLMSKLPVSYEFIQSKNARKLQLKEAIKAVKPLIKEDNARYEYKLAIKNIIDRTLKDPHDTSADKSVLLDSLKEEVVDNFIIYNFHKQNQEKSWEYKSIVHEAMEKYYSLVDADGNKTHAQHNTLLKSNQLLSELAKIPNPGENAILKEIEEIQIKFELTKLFNEISFIEDSEKVVLKNHIKATLAKQLTNSIRSGDVFDDDRKIKEDVIKCLKKLDENIDYQKVELFVKRLKHLVSNNLYNTNTYDDIEKQHNSIQSEKEKTINKVYEGDISNEKTKDEQWLSLLPATPKVQDSKYYEPHDLREFTKTAVDIRSREERQQNFDRSLNQSGITYESFEKGDLLSSTIRKDDNEKGNAYSYGQCALSSNQNISCIPNCTNKTAEKSLNTSHTHQDFAQTINQPTDAECSTSEFELDKTQKSHFIEGEKKNSSKSSAPYIHRSINKDLIDTQSNTCQPQQPGFLISIPNHRTFESPYIHNQFSQQRTSSMLSQTPNQPQTEKRNHQSMRIAAEHFTQNTQEACTEETGFITPSASTQPIPDESSIPFQNVREPHSIIPSISIPSTTLISSNNPLHSCMRGQPCRRPSIAIFNPPGLQRSDEVEQTAIGCNTKGPVIEDEFEACACLTKRKRANVCSVHMRRHCRICNEVNPFCCRLPPYRYPSFYYH